MQRMPPTQMGKTTTRGRGMGRTRMLATAGGGILVVAGALAMVLPVVFPIVSCDFQGEGDVCYLVTFSSPASGTTSIGAPLVLGPVLLGAGLLLVLWGSRNRWLVGGVAVVAGLMAVLLAPLAESCAWSSDTQTCDAVGTVVFNVVGVACLMLGALLIALAARGHLRTRQRSELANART